MTTADRIRTLLSQGATTDEIVAATGASPDYCREYGRVWMQRYRETHPDAEKARRQRQRIQHLIRSERARQGRRADRVQKIVAPPNWYG